MSEEEDSWNVHEAAKYLATWENGKDNGTESIYLGTVRYVRVAGSRFRWVRADLAEPTNSPAPVDDSSSVP